MNQVKLEIRDPDNSIFGYIDIPDHDEFPLALSFSIFDIRSAGDRKTDFTKNFMVPVTKQNVGTLGHLYNANLVDDASRFALKDCTIVVNDIPVAKGKIQVVDIVSKSGKAVEYELLFFGGNKNWVTDTRNTDLVDLTLGDITWDGSAITDSWTDDSIDYLWPRS